MANKDIFRSNSMYQKHINMAPHDLQKAIDKYLAIIQLPNSSQHYIICKPHRVRHKSILECDSNETFGQMQLTCSLPLA